MALKKTHAAALCAALLAGGCSFAEDALFPVPRTGSGKTARTLSDTDFDAGMVGAAPDWIAGGDRG